jgi:hypothetical protein
MKTLGIKLGLVFSWLVFVGIGQTVFHCWNFNGTSPFSSPINLDNRIIGNGEITHALVDVENFAGNTSNQCIVDVAGAAFCPTGGASLANNGQSINLRFPTTGFQNIVLRFWARATTSGFNNNSIQYSTDGGINFSTLPGSSFSPSTATSGGVFSFSFAAVPGVNNNSDFEIRILLDGATGTTGNNRYDNITLEGDVISANSISIDNVSSLFYAVDCDNDDTGSVDFSATGTYSIGNEFQVELSNASGSFSSPLVIGVLNGAAAEGTDPSGTIPIIIPAGTQSGTGFRIRIVSTLPSITSLDNGTDIEIQGEICPTLLPGSQGLLINEFSNGPTSGLGEQEYYEFVVAGRCGETVDVRGYIIDDNNGTFTTNFSSPAGTGIAAGHLRLTNHAQWSNIPVGSLIVVYNEGDPNASLPPDDPFDSNNDSLYVIPHTFSDLVEINTTIPNAVAPADSNYAPATYGSTSWTALNIRNAGDAIQVRMPDGTYFHGVSYGGSEISGGPNNMKILNSGMGGMCGWFNSGDYLNASNWSTGTVAGNETPGLPNNAANYAWLRLMRDPTTTVCPVVALPISLLDFTAKYNGINTELNWQTASEQDNDYFTLSHSLDGKNFTRIAAIPGSGNTDFTINYAYTHLNTPAGINYYKLRSVDFDGTIHEKGIVAVVVEMEYVFYNQLTGQIFFPNAEKSYAVYDLTGRQVLKSQYQNKVNFTNKGIYLVVDEFTGKATKIFVN